MSRSIRFAVVLLASSLAWPAIANAAPRDSISLIGTELRIRAVAQATPTSQSSVTNYPASSTVSSDHVEFPAFGSFNNPNAPKPSNYLRLVDVAIDAGKDFIEIDFDNAKSFNQFSTGYQNTYVFTFDGRVPVELLKATIDTSVTTLGLTEDRVYVRGNELFVNVQGLSFNTSTFARIRLSAVEAQPGAPGSGSSATSANRQLPVPESATRVSRNPGMQRNAPAPMPSPGMPSSAAEALAGATEWMRWADDEGPGGPDYAEAPEQNRAPPSYAGTMAGPARPASPSKCTAIRFSRGSSSAIVNGVVPADRRAGDPASACYTLAVGGRQRAQVRILKGENVQINIPGVDEGQDRIDFTTRAGTYRILLFQVVPYPTPHPFQMRVAVAPRARATFPEHLRE